MAHLDGKDDVAEQKSSRIFTVKNLQEKNWKQAGTYLYLCTVTRFVQGSGTGGMEITEFFQAERGQFHSFCGCLLQLDSTYQYHTIESTVHDGRTI